MALYCKKVHSICSLKVQIFISGMVISGIVISGIDTHTPLNACRLTWCGCSLNANVTADRYLCENADRDRRLRHTPLNACRFTWCGRSFNANVTVDRYLCENADPDRRRRHPHAFECMPSHLVWTLLECKCHS